MQLAQHLAARRVAIDPNPAPALPLSPAFLVSGSGRPEAIGNGPCRQLAALIAALAGFAPLGLQAQLCSTQAGPLIVTATTGGNVPDIPPAGCGLTCGLPQVGAPSYSTGACDPELTTLRGDRLSADHRAGEQRSADQRTLPGLSFRPGAGADLQHARGPAILRLFAGRGSRLHLWAPWPRRVPGRPGDDPPRALGVLVRQPDRLAQSTLAAGLCLPRRLLRLPEDGSGGRVVHRW